MSRSIEFLSPTTLPPAVGYSQIARIKSGELLVLSGQVGLTPSGELAGGDYERQLEQAFRNVEAALTAAGATTRDLVKLNVFVASSVDLDVKAHMAIRDRFIDTSAPPASALVFVSRLVRPEWLVEIEAIAVCPR